MAIPQALSRFRTFESLQDRGFRIFWISMMAEWMGMNMQMLARDWFMYDLTTSALLLGLSGAATGIPMIIFSPLGGVLADRVDKRDLLTVGALFLGVIALTVAVIVSMDLIKWWYLLIGSFCNGTVFALTVPARQSSVPQLVGKKHVLNAVSLNSAGMNIARLCGPALAGFLIVTAIGIDGVYYIIAALFLVAAICMRLLPSLKTQGTGERRAVMRDVLEGVRYVRGNTVIMLLLLLAFITVIFGMPLQLLLPVFTKTVLDVDADRLGLLMSMIAVGSLTGAMAAASLREGFRGKGMLLLWGTVFLGGGILAFSFARNYAMAAILMIPIGLGQSGRMVINNALVLTNTPTEFQGRVMSLYMMIWGFQPLGTLPMGALADQIGIAPVLGVAGAMLAVIALVLAAVAPKLRRLP